MVPDQPSFAGNRFVVQRRLGAGGMGVVYQAFDTEQDRVVALKTLRNVDAAAVVRFKHEFRALADFAHPNLVALYELVADPDALFFTMELVNGESFLAYVRPDLEHANGDRTFELSGVVAAAPDTGSTIPGAGPASPAASRPAGAEATRLLDLRRLRVALRQLCEGVAAIHGAGMLHRDLKPSNVLVTRDEQVKILDFGLVTELAAERHRSEHHLAGTAAFMSPEQGARLPLKPASDWYAVGVMLYQALTGRLPFLGSMTDVLMDKQQFEPPPPHELVREVPEDLDALCVELLRRDPAARPPAREILRRLGSTSHVRGSTTSSSEGTTAFIGRDHELASLREAWQAAQRGSGIVQWIVGPSGMGKSTLVRRFLEELESDGQAVVLTGRCYERESVPFKAVDNVIDGLSQYVARLPPVEAAQLLPRDVQSLARVFPVMQQIEAVASAPRRSFDAPEPQEVRRRAFEALRELLARLSDRRPLVVAIDDLQWGDTDSAALLGTVLRAPDPPPLFLIVSCRSEDWRDSSFIHELRAELARSGAASRELELGMLARPEAERLALTLLDGAEADAHHQLDRILDEAQGSPFFIDELCRHVREGEVPAGSAVSLEEVLRARLRRLPVEASRLLAAIAVAARPLSVAAAARAARVLDPAALRLLKAGNLVRTRGGHEGALVECYHDRIRRAAHALVDRGDVRDIHRRLAAAIAASPQADAETLAHHYREAGDLAQAAASAVEAAAHAEKTLAFDRAARLYRLALELAPDQPRARELRVRLGEALANAGRGAAAAEAFFAAANDASAAAALDLRRAASSELLRAGHVQQGIAAFRDVLATVGMSLPATPRAALASFVWHRLRLALRGLDWQERDATQLTSEQLTRVDVAYAVTTGMGMVDSIRGADFQARQLRLALDAGEPHRIVRALAAEAAFVSIAGSKSRAKSLAVLAKASALARRLDTPEAHALVIGAGGVIDFQEGLWRQALEACERAEEILRDRCAGRTWELTTAVIFVLFALAALGRIKRLSQRLPALIKESQDRGNLYAEANLQAAIAYLVAIRDDDPQRGREVLAETMARWQVDAVHLPHVNQTLSLAYLDHYAGDAKAAYERIVVSWQPIERSLLLRSQMLRVGMLFARGRAALAYAAAGGPGDELLAAAERDARRLERERAGWATANATLLRAGIAAARGRDEEVLLRLRVAEETFAAGDMALQLAVVRWLRGERLGGDEGAALVGKGRAWFAAEGFRAPEKVLPLVAPAIRR